MFKKAISLIILFLISITILGFVNNTQIFAQTTLPAKSNISSIKVVLDNNYPPYIFMDNEGNPKGIIVDQWKLWEEKMGIKVEIYPMTWDKAQKEMRNGNYDVIDTIFQNSERDKLYDFSKPYANIDVMIFFPEEISGIVDVESLKGFSVAVKAGDASIAHLKNKGVFNLSLYNSYEDMVIAAKKGEVSILVMDAPPARYFMLRENIQNKFKHSKPIYTGEFHRAVQKGNTVLLETIEEGFSLITEREYSEINKKWFGTNTLDNKNLTYLMYGSLALLIVVLLLIGISYMLKRTINKKTKELKDNINILNASKEEILYMGYHDQLTGLYNRRFYEEELLRLDVKRNLPLTIAMGDVNGLKLINDSFGHGEGDNLLKKVADVLKIKCRADDIIARFGGDEFVILLPQTGSEEAEKVISRIEEALFKEEMFGVNISISFGLETKIDENENLLEIIKNAEDDMYRHKLYESSSMRSKTIDLIMNALYEKNTREMFHSKRVSHICEKIASEMNMDINMISQIRIAGLVHDIGKIGVDERILNSHKKLNEEKWKEIKKHCETGYRILSSVNEFSEIAEYVLEHQEKWDGTGYPRGLKGEEISIQARIIAIADSYDAMTSHRPYGEKLSEEEAIQEIKKCSGTQFDPDIAKIFIDKVVRNLKSFVDFTKDK